MAHLDIRQEWEWGALCPATVMRSLFCGAAAGAASLAVLGVASTLFTRGVVPTLHDGLFTAAEIFVPGFLLWVLALIAFGLAPWWLLHRMGFRSLAAALLLGFSLTFLVDLCLGSHLFGLLAQPFGTNAHEMLQDGNATLEVDYALTPHGWHLLLRRAAEMGAAGMIVAGVIWQAAYRGAGSEA
jgi:hypothetical protein